MYTPISSHISNRVINTIFRPVQPYKYICSNIQRPLPYKVAHPRDKRLVAHNGGAVYLVSNVARKPAASRSSVCTCAGPLMLLIFTMNARGDEETANFNCSQKSVKRDNHVSLITREEGRLLFPFPDLLEIEYDYSLARWNNLTIRAVNFYRVAFCFLAIKRVWNLSNRRGDYDVINLRQIIFTGVEMYESCCDL